MPKNPILPLPAKLERRRKRCSGFATSPWDVLLLDISLPDGSGIDLLRQIRPHKPELPILILSMHPEEQFAVSLLRAGANGYITKDAIPQQVVQAIRTLLNGRKYISPAVAQILADDVGGDGRPPHEQLSEREFQVFCKLAAGRTVGDKSRRNCFSATRR